MTYRFSYSIGLLTHDSVFIFGSVIPDYTFRDLFFCTEAEHGKHYESRQHRCEEVYGGDSEGITVAVVVFRIVGGVGDNGAEAKAQGKENLCCCLPPHLHICPNFQLKMCRENKCFKEIFISTYIFTLNYTMCAGTFG